MLVVCLCARFQANPKDSHMTIVKRILKYLRENIDVGLWSPEGVSLSLVGYSNSNHVECKLDR
uniref:Retrovirus-related Pol polyprotein from transposon TNT 1-94 n=1 Tax=Cajanus cajan TaxID=3821 RepID=A0A151S2L4_CAJCA|nr:hypothetical protein KK1_029243 [Cajanus cajan]